MEYAGRLHRFLAFLVDAIVISIIILVLGEVGVIDPLGNEAGASTQVVEAVIAFGYYILLTAAFGATLGKMALGIKVVDESGQKAGFFKVLIRETIGKVVSGLILLLGYIWVLFDGRRQGWHDKIAATFVVRR